MADLKSNTASAGSGTEKWGETFGCFEDCGGCMYVSCCPLCARCTIGEMIGPDVTVGKNMEPANEFANCQSCCFNSCTFSLIGALIGLVACPDKTCCFYDINIMKAAAVKLNKDSASPGPCCECCQVWCLGSCTTCLMYRELKTANNKAKGAPEATEMER